MRIDIEIPEVAVRGQHGVYVVFDERGEVLYIGRTFDLYRRLLGHRSQSAWFREIRSLEFTSCDGSSEARALEKSMIATFHPESNVNDFMPQQFSKRQTLPAWTVAKLVTMHEECVALRGQPEARERLDNYILALRNAGWTLAAIAEGLTMTREAVRLHQNRATRPDDSPGVPPIPVKLKPAKKVKPSISVTDLNRLKELQAQAVQVRGWTPSDSPLRAATERFSELLAEHHLAGVSIYRIAKQLGVTHLAVSARLARHGYIEDITGLPRNTRYGTRVWKRHTPSPWADGTCRRGHDVTDPANVRHINDDSSRPICRLCERVRCDEYQKRVGSRAADPARLWARAQGVPVPARGHVPKDVRAQYEAAMTREGSAA